MAVPKPSKKEKALQAQNATPQQSGVGMVVVDVTRLADDGSYSAVLPRGSRVFAVGWNEQAGVLLMYAAVPYPEGIDMQDAGLLDEVQRFWFVGISNIQVMAPTGTTYIGCVNVAPDTAMAVFAGGREE